MDPNETGENSKIPSLILKIVLGLIVALVIVVVFNIIFNQSEPESTQTAKVLKLTLTSPADNIATSQETISVSGSTGIKSLVTVSLRDQAKIIETQNNQFLTTLDLKEGKNTVTIVAYDPKTGESQTTTKEILMLDEDLTKLWKKVYFSA